MGISNWISFQRVFLFFSDIKNIVETHEILRLRMYIEGKKQKDCRRHVEVICWWLPFKISGYLPYMWLCRTEWWTVTMNCVFIHVFHGIITLGMPECEKKVKEKQKTLLRAINTYMNKERQKNSRSHVFFLNLFCVFIL